MCYVSIIFFFFKQKTAYEMRISDWSSDVCSSDLRNRLLSLNQMPETTYVDQEKVGEEVAYARRMFADNGWPVIDVTRQSIEETAAAIINIYNEDRKSVV